MNRLLIKSSICAADRTSPIDLKDGEGVVYKVNAKTITVTVDGVAHSIPIPAESEKYRE